MKPSPEVAPTTSSSNEAISASDERLRDAARSSTVRVTFDGDKIGNGSGFFFDSFGRIATDAHVAQTGGPLFVIAPDGKQYRASIEHLDDVNDVAILRAHGLDPAKYGFLKPGSRDVAQWTPTISAGFPGNWMGQTPLKEFDTDRGLRFYPGKVTGHGSFASLGPSDTASTIDELYKGSASAPDARAWYSADKFVSTSAIVAGTSGGPLIDARDGSAIGLNHGIVNKSGDRLFTPMGRLLDLADGKNDKFDYRDTYRTSFFSESNTTRAIMASLAFAANKQFTTGLSAMAGVKMLHDGYQTWDKFRSSDNWVDRWSAGTLGSALDTAFDATVIGVNLMNRNRTLKAPNVRAAMLGAVGGFELIQDGEKFARVGSLEDKAKFGAASVFDTMEVAGAVMNYIPRAKGLSLLVQGAGFLGRTAIDLIPDELVTEVTRKDGSRPPYKPLTW